jgi:hypothetical protein
MIGAGVIFAGAVIALLGLFYLPVGILVMIIGGLLLGWV